MNYTVQELATLSHVSIRTLRYYDAIGLLKPAFVAENNYRYYQEKQLVRLQQILFFKELGFELKQIKAIVDHSDFDTRKALQAHAHTIEQRMHHLQKLLQTIDATIKHLEGKKTMDVNHLYYGFDSEQHKQHEKDLDAYFAQQADHVQEAFVQHKKETHNKVSGWNKAQWAESHQVFDVLCKELTVLLKQQVEPHDKQVQTLIARHYAWLSNFWKPNKESYKGHAEFIMHTHLKNTYNNYHAQLADFVARGIVFFADHNL